ncbi:putative membrane protein [Rubidibacter lacunae KORDI 51-2]|uniref:Putative membrane protein n=1 Tax=Rubidibacter lacunae KORDI 51-2 TaxID=582515 RepID=U5DQP4_9CHRO|nr:TIGR00297 family protein [Rubidibacter lacunae]ERN42944.1 putative membrane protein [Rubidibacter lacunae KORDI 51-2]
MNGLTALAQNPWAIAIALNAGLLAIVRVLPKQLLTLAGIVHAWILGVLVWGTLGSSGYAILAAYFILGSAVTRVGMARKEAAGIAEGRSGARGPENVWGSALTGALCAVGVGLVDGLHGDRAIASLLILGYAASFSTKLSDTVASEIGKAYGRRTFLVTTLKPVPPGTEGAVSLEGTLAGIVGSLAIAGVSWGVGAIDLWGVLWCAIAAFVATTVESAIGATIQAKVTWMTNEVVNIINTTVGALVAIALALGHAALA